MHQGGLSGNHGSQHTTLGTVLANVRRCASVRLRQLGRAPLLALAVEARGLGWRSWSVAGAPQEDGSDVCDGQAEEEPSQSVEQGRFHCLMYL